MTSYRVTITNEAGTGCAVRVNAVDKDAAKVEAVREMVRWAKAYNAKYGHSMIANGVAWAQQSESHADYTPGAVRKVAAR